MVLDFNICVGDIDDDAFSQWLVGWVGISNYLFQNFNFLLCKTVDSMGFILIFSKVMQETFINGNINGKSSNKIFNLFWIVCIWHSIVIIKIYYTDCNRHYQWYCYVISFSHLY